MKNLTLLAACALMAAPMCMIAHAEPTTVREYADACIQVVSDAAGIIEKVTPATADASIEKLNALKPKMAEIMASESRFSEAERQMAFSGEKWNEVQGRMMAAVVRLEKAILNATPEEKAALERVWNATKFLCE